MLTVERFASLVEARPVACAFSAALGLYLSVRVLQSVLQPKSTSKGSSQAVPDPPSSLPIVRNTLDIMFFHRYRLYDWITDQCVAMAGRPWMRAVAGNAVVILSTPELFEDVLKTQFENFDRGGIDHFSDLFGRGILSSDGAEWFFHRKTASHLFSNQMMRDVLYEAVREKAVRLCDVLRQYEAREEPMSFKSVIMHFTTDVFGKIGFGVDLQALENGLHGRKGNEFVDAFATSTHMMYLRFMQPAWLWKLKRYFNIGGERIKKESREVIDKFVYRVIDESIAKKNAANTANSDTVAPKDLISLFLNTNLGSDESEENSKPMYASETQLIRDTVVNFIFAGKDTTSHSMAFFIVMMNRYPQVLAKIRQELNEKLPRSPATGELLIPSIDDLPQLTYLEAAIRENLRLNPSVPLVPRFANTDVVLCDGTHLKKGTRLSMCIYAAGRMVSNWGPDALEFKPERWLDPATGKLLVVSPFKFISFIGGRRNCIGMKFAMLELKCALAVLLSRFDFKTLEDAWEMTYEPALTMAVKGPLLVHVKSLTSEKKPAASA